MLHTRAFSLVELSIVLVILGLLTGGILTGQSLIRAAELRAVTTEYNQFSTAFYTFRDKYFAIAGDMRNATQFWGRLNANADCVTNSASAVAAPGACDGDGGGTVVATAGAGGQANEAFGFWQQLAHAGLIEGSYSGLSGADNGSDADIGDNVPASKLRNAGWSFNSFGEQLNDAGFFNNTYDNVFMIGGEGGSLTAASIISAEEAWNTDTKVDDGLPAQGKVMVRSRTDCTQRNGTVLTTASADAALLDATYNLANTDGTTCALIFHTR